VERIQGELLRIGMRTQNDNQSHLVRSAQI